ncbi:flagellar basal body-associated FliL family protein [Sulfitobacter donghicola]|uniref:Flagellar basal body-associated protein FliL n=1 Tax=Sulfitobacter donghicola DSW-25 = KCTC 12864 = JCM 14565 TaxID=1300350 RepID=A0A073IJT6_9RHOB|nr:flagellar basal body-associated FliL family protein [Sulfitobacter donghicola]KEJ90548.1 flagellar basal body-associated protein FliL [Sulfitobacter donghicola DSW-25 = KCTC 12864 = JCM 14565]KIN67793.1 Flagellar basal body-associated protein FliL [Sulfitobacter donghicola DSW-25 = KCTC 12864 = JCM 14565]
MKKLLPLILLFVGVGAGVGAGVFLRPEAKIEEANVTDASGEHAEKEDGHTEKGEGDEHAEHSEKDDTQSDEDHGSDDHSDEEGSEFVKLNNQFVVPIVSGGKVTSLVVMALSIEVTAGETDTVYLREPKVRDSFLQVLFDHANIGGFDGNFTDAQVLKPLRGALKEVAKKDLGKKVVKDVLIIEIARQDY